MQADVFQSFLRRKFRQSATDPPWSEADCLGTNFVRRVCGGFRVGNFYSAKKFFWRIPRRRQSDPIGPTRTQSESAAELFRHLDYPMRGGHRRREIGGGQMEKLKYKITFNCTIYPYIKVVHKNLIRGRSHMTSSP